jgi:hypothetical protein
MKAGKYWIGDLCYVLGNRWDEVCNLIIVGHKCLDGIFTLKDGTEFAIFSTAHGDGVYTDSSGIGTYPVDSGSIGCVLFSEIDEKAKPIAHGCGNIIDFKDSFKPFAFNGLIEFGDISIMTDYEEDEEDDWAINNEEN